MKFFALLLSAAMAAIAAFTALNWGAFVAPTTLSLGLATVSLPLGLLLLGLLAGVSALFIVFIAYLQTSVLLETRRHASELQANRKLADEAEASRFTSLRTFLEAELGKLSANGDRSRDSLVERVDLLEREVLLHLEQSCNGIAASLGEIEDRLEREGRLGHPR